MNAVVETGAQVCTLLGLLAGAVVLLRGRRLRPALGVLLDLLLAAGLLRLAGDPGWRDILAAAVVVGVRRVVSLDLLHDGGLGR